MSQDSLVSIIIPAYNRPEFLRQTIESAIQQTYRNIEIIVFDDCSPVNLREVVDAFQDPRIHFHRNSENLGLYTNAISAQRISKGKYIAYLNDDDLWSENFLEKLVPPLEANPDVVLAFSDHYIIDADGNIDLPATEKNTRYWKRANLKEGLYQPFHQQALVNHSIPVANAVVIRKDGIDWENDFPSPGADIHWDFYISYLACRSGKAAYYCKERLTQYRVHDTSMTQSTTRDNFQMKCKWATAEVFCYERIIEDTELQEFKPFFKKKLAKAKTALGMSFLRNGQSDLARPYFFQAWGQHKNLRTVIAIILSFMPKSLSRHF